MSMVGVVEGEAFLSRNIDRLGRRLAVKDQRTSPARCDAPVTLINDTARVYTFL